MLPCALARNVAVQEELEIQQEQPPRAHVVVVAKSEWNQDRCKKHRIYIYMYRYLRICTYLCDLVSKGSFWLLRPLRLTWEQLSDKYTTESMKHSLHRFLGISKDALGALSRAYAGTGFGDDTADWEGHVRGDSNSYLACSVVCSCCRRGRHGCRRSSRGGSSSGSSTAAATATAAGGGAEGGGGGGAGGRGVVGGVVAAVAAAVVGAAVAAAEV